MVDFVKAIKRPFQDILTLVIGTIIGLIPLVQLLLIGFAANAAQNTFKKSYALPKWSVNNVIDFVIKAILVMVIQIIYMIPAMIVLMFGAASLFASIMGATQGGGDVLAVLMPAIMTGGIFILLGVILAIIGGVFSVMGIMSYLKANNFGAAFNFGAIMKKVLTLQFWIGLIVMVVYGFILFVIMGLLFLVPMIGGVLAIIFNGLMMYLLTTTSYTVFANVFMETP
jgi:hypothetical protein